MLQCVVISPCPAPLELELKNAGAIVTEALSLPYGHPPAGSDRKAWVLRTFDALASQIDAVLCRSTCPSGIPDVLAILDIAKEAVGSVRHFNALQDREGLALATVGGMLTMAYPEVHWMVANPIDFECGGVLRLNLEWHILQPDVAALRCRCAVEAHEAGFTALFDPTGFVTEVRKATGHFPPVATHIPERTMCAAAVDEELPYAYLSAYCAYRHGFLTHIVTTYQMMRRLFYDRTAKAPSLVFEDLFLRFADMDEAESRELDDETRPNLSMLTWEGFHLSSVRQRDAAFPVLTRAQYRVFVTVGHERNVEIRKDNESYLHDLRADPLGIDGNGFDRHIETMYKPISGVFALWEESGLRRLLPAGKTGGYCWPPPELNDDDDARGHSAPGRLLLIADRLLSRARRILADGPSNPEQALYGATLALNAKEYLGHRTPTASLTALAVQHELEVIAESMFHGVAYHPRLKRRFEELQGELDYAAGWFRKRTRKRAKLDVGVTIAGKLSMRFREHNQFDEEITSLDEVRRLHWRLLCKRHEWTVGLLSGYAASFTRHPVLWISGWLAALSFAYALTAYPNEPLFWAGIWDGAQDGSVTFFAMQPPRELQCISTILPRIVAIVGMIAGFCHLGLLISYVSTRLQRR